MASAEGLLALPGAGPALADQASVTDPTNDTQMSRNDPDIVATRISAGQRIVATVTYDSASDVAYAKGKGTITGVNLEFKNGRSHTLQRHAADSAWGTPLMNEIISTGAQRVKCAGVTSSVNTPDRTVTVSAPTSCFEGKGTKLRARGFSFTVGFDTDETRWTKRVAEEPSAKKKKVTYKIVRLGEAEITAVQTRDTTSGGVVRNTQATAKFSGLRCVGDACSGAAVTVSACLKLQRRLNGSWKNVSSLPRTGVDTVVAPELVRTFPNSAVIRYVWSGRATLGNDSAPFNKVATPSRLGSQPPAP